MQGMWWMAGWSTAGMLILILRVWQGCHCLLQTPSCCKITSCSSACEVKLKLNQLLKETNMFSGHEEIICSALFWDIGYFWQRWGGLPLTSLSAARFTFRWGRPSGHVIIYLKPSWREQGALLCDLYSHGPFSCVNFILWQLWQNTIIIVVNCCLLFHS